MAVTSSKRAGVTLVRPAQQLSPLAAGADAQTHADTARRLTAQHSSGAAQRLCLSLPEWGQADAQSTVNQPIAPL